MKRRNNLLRSFFAPSIYPAFLLVLLFICGPSDDCVPPPFTLSESTHSKKRPEMKNEWSKVNRQALAKKWNHFQDFFPYSFVRFAFIAHIFFSYIIEFATFTSCLKLFVNNILTQTGDSEIERVRSGGLRMEMFIWTGGRSSRVRRKKSEERR